MSREFAKFTKEWAFIHTTSSTYHRQANGLPKNMVQTARRILRCWNTKHTNWWTWISSTNCYSTFSTNINRLSKGLRKPGPFGNRNQNLFFDNMCSSPKLLDNLLSQETYRVAWNFRGSLFSRISRIFRRFAKIKSRENKLPRKKNPRKFTPFI